MYNSVVQVTLKSVVLAVGLSLFGSSLASAQNADGDGCYRTSNSCVRMSGEWKGDRFVSRYTNHCNGRIYIRFCNYRNGGNADCGASGLSAGRTKAWSTYKNANGRYEAEWVGSLVGSKDWVCSGKVRGWGSFGN